MAEFEPPSFSLGLDLEFESEPQIEAPNSTTHKPSIENKQVHIEDQNDAFQLRVSDSEPDDPGPTFRRLRRGGPSYSKRLAPSNSNLADNNDDIEEFSSPEHVNVRTDDLVVPQHHSLCSSSKIPLSGCGILKSQQESKLLNRKRKQDSSCLPSTSLASSKGKSKLLDLTASPLRRFRLLDSDSDSGSDFDDPSEGVHLNRDGNVVSCSEQNEQKGMTRECRPLTCDKKTESSTPVSQKQDLWKDFYADKSCAIPTPAFDEFFEEYYAGKPKNDAPGSSFDLCSSGKGEGVHHTVKMMEHQDLESASPPSHRYFFHDDLRIQSLIRTRLPYFFPLGASSDTGNKPYHASTIDYMSQFCHGDGAKKQTGRQGNVRETTRRSGKKTNNANVEGTSHASGDWIDPKQTNTPKDAGRRRVRADGQSAGQWFTAENGMKVYVTRTGQELTGRAAYRHYSKESGKGFKRSRKKSASNKKTAASNKKTASKKKVACKKK